MLYVLNKNVLKLYYLLVFCIIIFILICFYVTKMNKNSKMEKYIDSEDKTIWIYWDQGWEDAPLICKACLQSWKVYNRNEWNVIQLDRNNIKKYIDMEKLVPTFNDLPLQFKSDVLRINLLQKFNGLWVDATLFCTKPLNTWIGQYDTFFAFSYPSHDRLISSWFLYSKTNNYIVDMICKEINLYCRNKLKPENYFQFHFIITELYRTDKTFRTSWDNVTPKISAKVPQSLKYPSKRTQLSNEAKNHIDKYESPVYKLDHNKDSDEALQSKNANAYSYLMLKHNTLFGGDRIIKTSEKKSDR